MSEKLFASYNRKRQFIGGKTCCVPLCFNNTREDAEKELTFYTFPKDDAERSLDARTLCDALLVSTLLDDVLLAFGVVFRESVKF